MLRGLEDKRLGTRYELDTHTHTQDSTWWRVLYSVRPSDTLHRHDIPDGQGADAVDHDNEWVAGLMNAIPHPHYLSHMLVDIHAVSLWAVSSDLGLARSSACNR